MSLWLLQKTTLKNPSLLESLYREFAVRILPTLPAYQNLSDAEKKDPPQVIIITSEFSSQEVGTFLNEMLKISRTLFVILLDARDGEELSTIHPSRERRVYPLSPFESREDLNLFLRKLCALSSFEEDTVHYNGLHLDMERLECKFANERKLVPLSLKEAKLLRLLMRSAGTPISRRDILAKIWDNVRVSPRTIDCHISRLRKKLTDAPISIESVYGGGYIFQ